jgi:NADH dehydrogenase
MQVGNDVPCGERDSRCPEAAATGADYWARPPLAAGGAWRRCATCARDPAGLGAQRVRVQLRSAISPIRPAAQRAARADTVARRPATSRGRRWRAQRARRGACCAAERVGAQHFLWLEPLGDAASPDALHRAKAFAAAAVAAAPLPTTTIAHSLLCRPATATCAGSSGLLLPAVRSWAGRGRRSRCGRRTRQTACSRCSSARPPGTRVELAPELTQREVAARPSAAGHRRRTLPVPLAGLRAALRAEEALAGPTSLVTWVELARSCCPATCSLRARGRPTPRRFGDAAADGGRTG